jgi:hypothetical protein
MILSNKTWPEDVKARPFVSIFELVYNEGERRE